MFSQLMNEDKVELFSLGYTVSTNVCYLWLWQVFAFVFLYNAKDACGKDAYLKKVFIIILVLIGFPCVLGLVLRKVPVGTTTDPAQKANITTDPAQNANITTDPAQKAIGQGKVIPQDRTANNSAVITDNSKSEQLQANKNNLPVRRIFPADHQKQFYNPNTINIKMPTTNHDTDVLGIIGDVVSNKTKPREGMSSSMGYAPSREPQLELLKQEFGEESVSEFDELYGASHVGGDRTKNPGNWPQNKYHAEEIDMKQPQQPARKIETATKAGYTTNPANNTLSAISGNSLDDELGNANKIGEAEEETLETLFEKNMATDKFTDQQIQKMIATEGGK